MKATVEIGVPDALGSGRSARSRTMKLENLIQRALILSPDRILTLPPGQPVSPRSRVVENGSTTLEGIKRAHIVRVLEETNWTVGGPRGAAARLGLKRTTLQSLLKRLQIAPPADPLASASI